jgi:hypothetical protein
MQLYAVSNLYSTGSLCFSQIKVSCDDLCWTDPKTQQGHLGLMYAIILDAELTLKLNRIALCGFDYKSSAYML